MIIGKARALVATHHLFSLGGSELVAFEFAEEIGRLGYSVDLFCPFTNVAFVDGERPEYVDLYTSPEQVDLGQYGVVYGQHQTLSQIIARQSDELLFGPNRPALVFNHLSPYEPYEFPGPFIEADLADAILCNSAETGARLEEFGSRFERRVLFPNPAPARFDGAPLGDGARLSRLLSISKHVPAELSAAFDLLRAAGVEVTRIGLPECERRVVPEDIAKHDAVVTIGKSVQYSLRGRRPVYCYDHYAGPGWLTDDNFDATAWHNFAGRSHPDKKTPEAIAQEIISGFESACATASGFPEARISPFKTENAVATVLMELARAREVGRPYMTQDLQVRASARRRWAHEAALYQLIDREGRSDGLAKPSFAQAREEFDRRRWDRLQRG